MKKLFLTLVAGFFSCTIFAQCNLLPNATPGITLVHQATNCFNNSGVAYNPNLGLYYGARAGNSSFPLETWSATGAPLNLTTTGFDYRGMWWNPSLNQMECNGFNTFGIWTANLDINGYALNTGTVIFPGMNQPNSQSCGDLDYDAYEILYYNNGSIHRYSRATNVFLGSYPITGTPVAISNLNSTTVMYTGCPGMEIALLDVNNKRVYVYNKATGAYAGMSQLPASAVTTNSFRTSWANCHVWLFDLTTRTWFGYKIFDNCGGCPPVLTTVNLSICAGDSIFVGGAFQTTAGAYHDTLTAANSCDSIITTNLTITPPIQTNDTATICQGDSLFVGGAWQTTAGTYYDTLMAANSCDSIVATTISVTTAIVTNNSVSICQGASIFLGGALQSTSGTYYDTLTASSLCDSVIITNLTVTPPIQTNSASSICLGDSMYVGGAWQTTSGAYIDSFTTAGSCDSFHTTNLTVINPVVINLSSIICAGDSLYAGGAWQTSSGVYADTFVSASQCDSIRNTTLTVLVPIVQNQNATICTGDSLFVGGAWRTTSGVYADTFSSVQNCDSVILTNLSVTPPPVTNLTASICQGDSLFVGGGWQSNNGMYVDTLNSVGGCDSLVYTNLSVIPPINTTANLTRCEGQSVFLAGAWQTTSGVYQDIYQSVNGCDSLVTTTLTILPGPITNLGNDTTLCEGESLLLDAYSPGGSVYLWFDNSVNTTYLVSQAGTYYVSVEGGGCISPDTITVSYNPNPVVDLGPDLLLCNGDELVLDATVANASYIWSTGGIGSNITVTQGGEYWVLVTKDGCSRSDSISINYYANDCNCSLFMPNAFTPNNDGRNDAFGIIENVKVAELLQFSIYNRWGEPVFESTDPTASWDGSHKGEPAPTGSFYYVVKYRCLYDGKEYVIKGDLTLIK